MVKNFFKGFGKPELTMDERQRTSARLLTQMISDRDSELWNLVKGASNSQICLEPKRELNKQDTLWHIEETKVRWDVLNPGCPNYVPIHMVVMPLTQIRKTGDLARSIINAVFNRSTDELTMGLQLSNDDENCSVYSINTKDKDKPLTMKDKDMEVLGRFSMYSTYSMIAQILKFDGKSIDEVTEDFAQCLNIPTHQLKYI